MYSSVLDVQMIFLECLQDQANKERCEAGDLLALLCGESVHLNIFILAATADAEVIDDWDKAVKAKEDKVTISVKIIFRGNLISLFCSFFFVDNGHHPEPVAEHVGPPLLRFGGHQRLPLLGPDAARDLLQGLTLFGGEIIGCCQF